MAATRKVVPLEQNEIIQIRQWVEAKRPHAELDVLVTPDIAKLLLSYNKPGETNRYMSKDYVQHQVKLLQNGFWKNTGEPIIMSDEGILNDGQHRLQAVVESNVPSIMDLRFGVPREAFVNTNAGRKRSAAQVLMMAGRKDTLALSAAARMALCYERGLRETFNQRTGNGEIMAAIERWPDLQDALKFTNGNPKPLRNAAINTLAFFAQRTENETSVANFFDILKSGEGSASNPPHILREFLLLNKIKQGESLTMHRVRVFAYCIICWNAWRTAKEVKRLYWTSETPFPVCLDLKL